MPQMAKTPFSSKSLVTITKSYASLGTPLAQGAGPIGEVVCPLFNSDGSQCRKKCVGNFAYRSICEHIRRAHPDNWIPKLPASPETFAKMVNMTPRVNNANSNGNNANNNANENGIMIHHHNMPKKQSRKPSKLSKEEEYSVEGMSPPPSANESESNLPSIAIAAAQVAQNYASRFHYEYPSNVNSNNVNRHQDDQDMDGEHDIEEDMIRPETDDEDYAHSFNHNHYQYQPYSNIHHMNSFHHHHQQPHPIPTAPRAGVSKPKSQKRKRQSTLDSISTTSSGFSSSRWDELIEAATTRAVVETQIPANAPLSPPQTAQTLPSICPNTPSGHSIVSGSDREDSVSTSGSGLRVECAECRTQVSMGRAFICTECVSGFCEPCALENGKKGVCSECRVFGARWKPLNCKVVLRP